MKSLISNTDNFISKSIILHGDKYDYSNVKYVNAKTKVVITCKIHGKFYQKPTYHLIGCGCPYCGEETVAIKRTKDTDYFVEISNKIHSHKYSYHKTEYVNSRNKVIITCNKHGDFTQKPNAHLNGQGCPVCNESVGERCIGNFLNNNNICFIREKSFENCTYKKKLQFDFFLHAINVCIEYDGIQHFEPVKHFGGQHRFNDLKIKDEIKSKYCNDNGIKLIRIPYTEFKNIEIILKNELKL
jgi:very-short-patch-repair endonuclease/Zn finger protein HypA/HybF involved in hydrogenase expression